MKPVEDGAHVGHFAAFGVKLTRREGLHHQEQRGETQQRCDQSVQRAGPGIAQAQRPPGVVPLHHAVRRDVLCRRTEKVNYVVLRCSFMLKEEIQFSSPFDHLKTRALLGVFDR